MSGMHAIVDSDSLIYAAGFASQRTIYLACTEEGFVVADFETKKECLEYIEQNPDLELEPHVEAMSRDTAAEILDSMLTVTLHAAGAETCRCYITGSSSWRSEYATIYKYKGNRENMVRPVHYDFLRSYIVREWHAYVVEWIEADDAVIMEYNTRPRDSIICSIDKDLRQQHGLHLNPRRTDEGVFEVSEWEALVNFYTQTLTGDACDNIKGLSERAPKRGVGAARAAKMLAECSTERELFEASHAAYVERYGNSHTYESWKGEEMTRSAMEIMDENCQLLYLARCDGDKWRVPR